MRWLSGLAEYVIRALHLLALTIAPTSFSPEPTAPSGTWLLLQGVGAAAVLALLLAGAARLARNDRATATRVAAALAWVAVAACLAGAVYWSRERAPLERAVPFVALPVWAALAAGAFRAADVVLAPTWKQRNVAMFGAVVALAAIQMWRGSELFASTHRMWWTALWIDEGNDRAAEELTRVLLRQRRFEEARRVSERCLARHPAGIACLDLRARISLRAGAAEAAIADARTAIDQCPSCGVSRAILAEALALSGDAGAAEMEARAGLTRGGPEDRLRYALALALEKARRYDEAAVEAKRAIALGAGRDAKLLSAALGIVTGDLDGAAVGLAQLVKDDPDDAEARYDLALIADRKNDYNNARQGYIAALRADPTNASARYNLALLTWRAGAKDESRHHVQRFRESFPGDPRGLELARITSGGAQQ